MNSACLDVTIIRQGRPQHLRRLDTEVGEKKSVLYDYVQELKETVFGRKILHSLKAWSIAPL